ncbi:ABC transporter substrate-binding protein [Pararhizobium mangrovi]|uniref:ABC transporter substrate-binding protein n=1 Tax=Pararhizobium mangrovi TaxID=2590452 RepID=A0A506TYI8_9HYPH|nr:ABC transporter substrate-binding protein [Pararhizobium mangrovi]TPW26268.1 ABC transporter substrate-binding protein [Pararhizobium mangrovi]
MTARMIATLLVLLLGTNAGAAASRTQFDAASGDVRETLTIASVTDLWAFRPLIAAFQSRHPEVAISYLQDTSRNLDERARAACRDGAFLADVIVSTADAEQVRFVNDGCSQPIAAPAIDALPEWAHWRGEVVGLTVEPGVIVYNRAGVAADEVPRDRFALVDLLRRSERFTGRIGTYDIVRSGVGYLFAFEDAVQATTWGRLIESFGRNDVGTYCCTGEILDRVADGRLLLGYNVLGSYAMARARKDPRIGIVFPRDYTLALTRAALVPKAAHEPELASAFIAFALSRAGRTALEKGAGLMPAATGIATLQAKIGGSGPPIRPVALSPALLVALDEAKKTMFLKQWRQSIASVPETGETKR